MGTMGSLMSIIFTILIIILIIIFFVSLFSFIRRTLTNSSVQNNHAIEMDKKLDKIIKLLEENKNNQEK